MRWRVALVVAHVEENDRRQTHGLIIDAESQMHAADQALGEGLPFAIGPHDELLVYVEPSPKQPEETGIYFVYEGKGKPQTREDCLRRAEEQGDPGWKKWWTDEAARHKPAAEGGGYTDEAKAAREAEDRAWHERQKSPRRDPT